MSVIFDQAALNFLLQDPAGPTGLMLERVSENIIRGARQRADFIFQNKPIDPSDYIGYDIRNGDNGLEAVFGAEGGPGSIGYYLAEKDANPSEGQMRIFTESVQEELHN
jgi:hypothetical protein